VENKETHLLNIGAPLYTGEGSYGHCPHPHYSNDLRLAYWNDIERVGIVTITRKLILLKTR